MDKKTLQEPGSGVPDDELARLMKIPDALEAYHGWMHGRWDFPFDGCDMADLGPHGGPYFEAGLERGLIRGGHGDD